MIEEIGINHNFVKETIQEEVTDSKPFSNAFSDEISLNSRKKFDFSEFPAEGLE